MEENKEYRQVFDQTNAPNISRLAKTYGVATQFYAEVHPSEPNYVALVSGDTYGIHDDDAFYCTPGDKDPFCEKAAQPGYQNHTVTAAHIGSQLEKAGLSWKGYYESIPQPGSKAIVAGDRKMGFGAAKWELYASKHSGFINFASVQHSSKRALRLVGFDQLDKDLASGAMPSFALIVPNQCNEMHGLYPSDYPSDVAAALPADCNYANITGLIRRGDAVVGRLVAKIQRSAAWRSSQNVAIVITFDEGAGKSRAGCCGIDPASVANFGGGHIATVVVTNHGPRGVVDNTPYSHYSLLRTIEDAFGIHEYLGHAADSSNGVRPMTPLFVTKSK
ncbi:MAG: phosphoesterase [Candidatus Eremiobacteraeota bacterium]|nr:phosphoesterase [Candidatus Eremiobacteraeota bacterium]